MPKIEYFDFHLEQLQTRIQASEQKLTTIEKHLPTMIEEMLRLCLESAVAQKTEPFVTKEEVSKLLEEKMPWTHFRDFERRMI